MPRAPRRFASTEADRYRRAAEEALNQLEWSIDYLYRIRKPQIAAALGRNVAEIARRMR